MMETFSIILLTIVLSAHGFNTGNIHNFASSEDLSIDHLKEHYGNKIEIEKHTSAGDRQFFYFNVGDTNKDHHLDGIEMFKMITEHMNTVDVESVEVQIDQVLSDFDMNFNGMISYSEYSRKFKN